MGKKDERGAENTPSCHFCFSDFTCIWVKHIPCIRVHVCWCTCLFVYSSTFAFCVHVYLSVCLCVSLSGFRQHNELS